MRQRKKKLPIGAGQVVNIDPLPSAVLPDSILIRPHSNPDALNPPEEIHFARFVDRGAVVVNGDRKVVGVLYDEIPLQDPDGRKVFHGVAMPIISVLHALAEHAGVKVEVAVAGESNDVRVANGRIALSAPERAAEWSGVLPEDLLRSPAGQLPSAAWHLSRAPDY